MAQILTSAASSRDRVMAQLYERCPQLMANVPELLVDCLIRLHKAQVRVDADRFLHAASYAQSVALAGGPLANSELKESRYVRTRVPYSVECILYSTVHLLISTVFNAVSCYNVDERGAALFGAHNARLQRGGQPRAAQLSRGALLQAESAQRAEASESLQRLRLSAGPRALESFARLSRRLASLKKFFIIRYVMLIYRDYRVLAEAKRSATCWPICSSTTRLAMQQQPALPEWTCSLRSACASRRACLAPQCSSTCS